MAVWDGDSTSHLELALKSLEAQVFKDFEVILVCDGISEKIREFVLLSSTLCHNLNLKYYELAARNGPAQCWNYGIDNARGEYIVRMDPDDIMRADCIKKQVEFMGHNKDVDICGGQIEEFNSAPGDLGRCRIVPTKNDEIRREMLFRNPLNHVTVIIRTKSLKQFRYEQLDGFVDYLFWLKLKSKNFVFANLADTLVDVRVGNNFVNRRLGLKYAMREIEFCLKCGKNGYFNYFTFIRCVLVRPLVRLLPKRVVSMLYQYIRTQS